MKKKILILLVSMALLVGVLSGCTEEETPPAVKNNAPVAVIAITQDGLMITYDASGSTDADDDTLTYSWTFGDEVGTSTEATGTYTYTASGPYTVTLIVNDGTDDSEADTEDLTITNPPTVTLGALPDTIATTTQITFEATAVEGDAEVNATTGYAWSIDNGTSVEVQEGETAPTFIHIFEEEGVYVVTVVATDDLGLTATATVTVTVPTTPAE